MDLVTGGSATLPTCDDHDDNALLEPDADLTDATTATERALAAATTGAASDATGTDTAHAVPAPATRAAVVISFRGTDYPLVGLDPATATLGDLRAAAAAATGVPPELQKLLHRRLRPDTPDSQPLAVTLSLSSASVAAAPERVLLVGSTAAAVQEVARRDAAAAEFSRARAAAHAAARRMGAPRRDAEPDPAAAFTFDELRPLEEFADADAARRLLARLRDDPGVRAVMAQNRFRVGILGELHPVRSPTLLGLNTNHGAKIELRLRTDALDGFRHYASVRRVLMHELAHNRHGGHGPDFVALDTRLARDCERLGAGATAGGGDAARPRFSEEEEGSGGAGPRTLGGGALAASLPAGASRRELLAAAAQARLAAVERELAGGVVCGDSEAAAEPPAPTSSAAPGGSSGLQQRDD
ncbi:hypothetical protein HK405_015147 [Cladochytrium tenue]|nr:hypothetical protein HK405_015147 [Cladochytrium tenue]